MKKIVGLLLALVSNFSFAQNWNYNFDEAVSLAQNEDKNIIIVFSGSDWCAPCIKLEKNIWQSEVFKNESEKEWVLVKANFPRKKANELPKEQTEHNRKLAEKYNVEGSFPILGEKIEKFTEILPNNSVTLKTQILTKGVFDITN
jgi:thioredoxin-related protein